MRKLILSAVFCCGMFPALLSAQDKAAEKYKFGLTFPNIGIIWRISDNVAFLPGINISHGWSDLGTNPGNSTTNTVGVDAILRFYVHDWKGIRFYLGPKYGYNWSNVESPFQGSTMATELRAHSVTGAWGIEYAVSHRISLFGDIGVRYNHGRTDSTASFSSATNSNTIGTAGSWGLILHLK